MWHQYDDTIFSPPSWFQSIRNKMPFLKSMDAADGRNIATWAMLPRWEGFIVDALNTSMTAWEAVEVVNDVAYCMTQTLVEEDERLTGHVPYRYDFKKVCYQPCFHLVVLHMSMHVILTPLTLLPPRL